MMNTLLLTLTLSADTTVTFSTMSRDMQLGRDMVTTYLLTKVGQLGCTKYVISDKLTLEGTLYKWTGTLTCTR
jgi:hypothetical protein